MTLNFNAQANLSSLFQFSDSIENLVKSTLNCCRVAVVEEFNAEELTVRVQLVNKMLLGINKDGTQETMQYPPIYAKVCYCNSNISVPIGKGTAGLVLFSDREIESYFINGDVNNNLAYERMHDITDGIFIPAVYSFVNTKYANLIDGLNMFYGLSNIQVRNNQINVNTESMTASNNVTVVNTLTTQTGVVNDTLTAGSVIVNNGASGSFTSQDGKSVTVTNGIVTAIN